MSKPKKSGLAFHWQILIGMAAGVAFGIVAVQFGWQAFTTNWIKPFGTLFVNALKLIALPLVVVSLIKGVSDLQNISKLSSLGGRTAVLYVMTTVIAATIGLVTVNIVQPGKRISQETRETLEEKYSEDADDKISSADAELQKGPLQTLVDVVPSNFFLAATNNRNMLQVIFVVIMFGIGLVLVSPETAAPIRGLVAGVNATILKLIELIMFVAPYCVFALMAALIVDTESWEIIKALIIYGLCVIFSLAVMILVFYPTVVRVFTGTRIADFMKAIAPAQLLAFTTSSSAATLPVTMECVEEELGVENEVASFVLPIGTTVNMDGTSIHQAISAIFVAQAFNIDLTISQQITVVIMASLVSIGAPAIPSAGLVMLVVVLESIGVPQAGLALIFAVDRILDMCRTSVNVTGDATVSMLVAKSVGRVHTPN